MNRFSTFKSPIKAQLHVISGNTTENNITVSIPCVIGRGQDVDLTIDHPTVSRRHCKIDTVNGRVVLCDLGSRNGTILDGSLVNCVQPVELESQSQFSVGPITFRIEYAGARTLAPVHAF